MEFKFYMKPTVVEQAKDMGEYKVFVLHVLGFENYFINNLLGLMKAMAAELAFCIWEKRENLLSKSLVKKS